MFSRLQTKSLRHQGRSRWWRRCHWTKPSQLSPSKTSLELKLQPSLAGTRAEEPRPETVEAVTEEVAVRIEAGEARVVVGAEDPDMSLTHQIVVATAITGMVLLLGTVSSR